MKGLMFFGLLVLSIGLISAIDISGTTGTGAINLLQDSSFNNNTGSVNSSDYWDLLDTPADINAGDITDDNTYCRVDGETMTGTLNMETASITFDDAFGSMYGTGSDASVMFDGDSLNILANEVFGGDDLYIQADRIIFNLLGNMYSLYSTGGQFVIDSGNEDVLIPNGTLLVNSVNASDGVYLPDSQALYLGNSVDDLIYHNGSTLIIDPSIETRIEDILKVDTIDTGVITTSVSPLQAKANSGGTFLLAEENSGTEYFSFGIDASGEMYFSDDSTFKVFAFGETGDFGIKGDLRLNNVGEGIVMQMPIDGNTRYGLKTGSAGNLGDEDTLALSNRAVDGVVEIQADDGNGGATGETRIARFEDNNVTVYGSLYLDELVKIQSNSSAITCDGTTEGSIYYDADTNKHRGCDGSTWNDLY